MTIPIHRRLAAVCAPYDGLILDVWGCLHDGGAIFAEARESLVRLRAAGKRVVLLSNAPRRARRVGAALRAKGLADGLFEAIVTSGDALRAALDARDAPWTARLGRRFHHLGPARDAGLLDGLAYRRAGAIAEADFILCTGLDGPDDAIARHEPVLGEGLRRALPLICANPDREVVRAGRRELCAGALAQRYAERGGVVHAFGKPYPEVYRLCLDALALAQPARVLAVGDGLETDIRGAAGAGLDSLLVTGGLLAPELETPPGAPPDARALDAICRRAGVVPDGAIARLVW